MTSLAIDNRHIGTKVSMITVIITEHLSMPSQKGEITILLDRLADGDRVAEEMLIQRVYMELHRIAINRLRSERQEHSLQATALVHEAYMRLCRTDEVSWQNRAHFFCIAARMMRQILVDHARRNGAQKRNNGIRPISLDQAIELTSEQSSIAIEIDELLQQLAKISPRQASVVEMRFFGGLNDEEIALALGKTTRTVCRDWLMARAWLHGKLAR
jgi:RNA polymerase sigma factor (TIGR02999 family)